MKFLLKSIILSSAAILPNVAVAQEAAPSSADQPPLGGLEEIIVTAQRRSERLQDVPIAVTAVTANRLAATRIENATDLAALTPSLTVPATQAYFQPRIRGVGTLAFGPGIENPVATYIDGVYLAQANSSLLSFTDVERVEVLKELVPKATRIALLSNPEHSGELGEYRVTEDAAKRLGATITRHLVRNPQELTAAFSAIRASPAEAMIVFPDSLTLVRRKEIADFAAQAKIPCMYGWTEFVDAGGLISYGPSIIESFKLLAAYVDKVLKAGSANNIPIEQVSAIKLTVNFGAARALGLNVPSSILARADKVIE